MIIQKLDGPKGDPILDAECNVTGTYEGVVVGAQADLVDGDWARWSDDEGAIIAEHRWFVPGPPPTPTPRVLTKTQFQDHAVSQLGASVTGMARFTEIMDATRASASGVVRFAFARYEAADKFAKSNTASLTTIMAADSQSGHITSAERTAILDNWPTQ